MTHRGQANKVDVDNLIAKMTDQTPWAGLVPTPHGLLDRCRVDRVAHQEPHHVAPYPAGLGLS